MKDIKEFLELSDDELEKVSGGGKEKLEYGVGCGTCPVCGCTLMCVYNITMGIYTDICCDNCGHTEPDRKI